MTQTEINQIRLAIELAYIYTKEGLTEFEVIRKVFDNIPGVTSPSAGIYMPTELYDKMTTEGI